jgi:hypothetical protein
MCRTVHQVPYCAPGVVLCTKCRTVHRVSYCVQCVVLKIITIKKSSKFFDLLNIDISSSNIQFAFSVHNTLNLIPCHSLENIFHLSRKNAFHNSEKGRSPVHLSVAPCSVEVRWTISTDIPVIFEDLHSCTEELLTRCSNLIFVTYFQFVFVRYKCRHSLNFAQRTLFRWTLMDNYLIKCYWKNAHFCVVSLCFAIVRNGLQSFEVIQQIYGIFIIECIILARC